MRSSSDPDLQSNRPSVDLEDEEHHPTGRRSRTPGPMRRADGLPEPQSEEEEARFAPSRQPSACSVEGVLSEAEALRAAAARHLSALAGG